MKKIISGLNFLLVIFSTVSMVFYSHASYYPIGSAEWVAEVEQKRMAMTNSGFNQNLPQNYYPHPQQQLNYSGYPQLNYSGYPQANGHNHWQHSPSQYYSNNQYFSPQQQPQHSVATKIGSYNCGNVNSGNVNSGNFNSGNFNSGNVNSGNVNSGNVNSGNVNSGNVNSGNVNSNNVNSRLSNSHSGQLSAGNDPYQTAKNRIDRLLKIRTDLQDSLRDTVITVPNFNGEYHFNNTSKVIKIEKLQAGENSNYNLLTLPDFTYKSSVSKHIGATMVFAHMINIKWSKANSILWALQNNSLDISCFEVVGLNNLDSGSRALQYYNTVKDEQKKNSDFFKSIICVDCSSKTNNLCLSPEEIVLLLTRMQHFFKSQNDAFVLLMNKLTQEGNSSSHLITVLVHKVNGAMGAVVANSVEEDQTAIGKLMTSLFGVRSDDYSSNYAFNMKKMLEKDEQNSHTDSRLINYFMSKLGY